MALVVGALPHSQWQRLSPLLEAMGWDGRSSEVERWYLSDPSLNGSGDVSYVLLHSRPERCIAQALADGNDLKTAVSAWVTSGEALLAFYRNNRSKAVLLDVDAVYDSPDEALKWLAQNHAGLKTAANSALERSVRVGTVRDGQDLDQNLDLLVAVQAVDQSSDIQGLLPYFEAGSVPVGKETYARPLVDLMSTVASIETIKRNSKTAEEGFNASQEQIESLEKQSKSLNEQAKSLEEENELVVKELFKVQEELERYYLKSKDKDVELERLKADKEAISGELTSLKSKLEYTTSEMEKFSRDKQKEITAIRKTLSDKERALSKATKRAKKLERERDELNTALMAVQGSLFWRLTFPLRWTLGKVKRVGSLFRRRDIKKNVKVLQQSELFDGQWYLAQYPDVVQSGLKPEEHYVRHGAFEGRDPGPYFSSKNYLRANPDVAKAGLNPLVHYVLHGKDEGRRVA
ncbi:hypothetical protein [uncultured Marinimicrobium sp.]|jgi:predicted  nucleic acid-binding Zn-ribbon protein|uniref:hypothetical protein n=1 Tax=uncultured Marinimicrobium sp. TaxID=503840 RepID=UPI0030D9089B|tara:strand:- start:564 stop:1949 length:1386 start_codon:yes stop_codon:yes gene_type:complete